MTAVEVVCARLAQVSAVTALVSTRIWPMKLPQSPVFPAIRVTLVAQPWAGQLRGVTRRVRARVQVDALAREASGTDPLAVANAVADAAFGGGDGDALAGWTGALGSPAVTVSGVLPLDRREGYFADDLRQVVVSQDFDVWFDGV
ncbi:MAG: DUF3168 domain-containing protein [Betaproteobacteria bacterium]|nr:DUF3168 domain-containing protein [Betaproteobacteria bacterium]